MSKIRLDVLVFERGLTESRERAKTVIMSGQVFVDGQRADKPGMAYPEDCKIEINGPTLQYVSRGGLKMEKAMRVFPVKPEGRICMDIGASTGGFTDCLLQNGAVKVYAIDVGYGQLAWKLRNDPRVVTMERTNIRNVTPEQLADVPSLAVIDVSFISLRLVLPVVHELLNDAGEVICLIKPQFEAGKEKVGKKGVVRDQSVHKEVLDAFLENAASAGFTVLGLDFSPVRGPEGNIEYLGYLTKEPVTGCVTDTAVLVAASHSELDK